jgi:hypothetical protein
MEKILPIDLVVPSSTPFMYKVDFSKLINILIVEEKTFKMSFRTCPSLIDPKPNNKMSSTKRGWEI